MTRKEKWTDSHSLSKVTDQIFTNEEKEGYRLRKKVGTALLFPFPSLPNAAAFVDQIKHTKPNGFDSNCYQRQRPSPNMQIPFLNHRFKGSR